MTQTATPANPQPAKEPIQAPLGHRTSRGFAWMVSQTMLTKVLALVAQIVLAWFLSKKDMGLAVGALAVSTFPSVLRDAGLMQLLVNRHLHFRRWAGPVFWMSLTLGVASAVILAAMAPVFAHLYHEPAYNGLILLLAAGSFITALSTVPAAKVQADLRYKLQAWMALCVAVVTSALNIMLARLHFGPYSMILPMVLVNAARTVALWIASPYTIPTRLHLRRWRYLVPDSGVLLVSLTLVALVSQGDFLILRYLTNDDTLGLFGFAFTQSMQTLTLLTVNLGGLLFPALSKLQMEPRRQIEAFLRASRVFAAVAIPLCFFQAAAAAPAFHLIFKPLWYAAIPVLQVMSIAMAIRAASLPAQSLAAAQNRIRFNLLMTACNAVAFLGMVFIAAKIGGAQAAVAVAIAELIFFAISDPAYMYFMLRMNGRTIGDLSRLYAVPLLGASVAAWLGNWFSRLIPAASRPGYFIQILTVAAAMACIYFPLLRIFSPDVWAELLYRLKGIVSRGEAAR